MKRRDFIGASAILAFLAGSQVHAAPKKQSQNVPKKSTNKPAKKPSVKPRKENTKPVKVPPPAESPRDAISLPDEPPAQWQTYDIQSIVILNNPQGKARLWLPLAQYRDTPWERSLGHHWRGNFENAGVYRDPVADMEVFYADWSQDAGNPHLEITSRIAVQNRHFDITRRKTITERTEVLRRCLQSTELVPTDGIVMQTAERAIGRIKDPLAQSKAIYDWVVENTVFEPQMKNSGSTHIGQFLESGHLAGQSVEISLLFVAMCRSIGIPARPVFGVRLDHSRLFACLSASGNIEADRHCRAEFYSPGYGWVPVDPSDVRRAIHGECLKANDPKLTVLRKLLFGFWEMNWMGFNTAQDVILNGSSRPALPFLIAPTLETNEGRFDSVSSEQFAYSMNIQKVEG